jgi:hypothetical protein
MAQQPKYRKIPADGGRRSKMSNHINNNNDNDDNTSEALLRPSHINKNIHYHNTTTPINGNASRRDDVALANGESYHDAHYDARNDVTIEMTSRPATPDWKMLTLCVLTVVFNVMMNVSLPIYAGTMNTVGGDTFTVLLYGALWFPLVLAVLGLALKVSKLLNTFV